MGSREKSRRDYQEGENILKINLEFEFQKFLKFENILKNTQGQVNRGLSLPFLSGIVPSLSLTFFSKGASADPTALGGSYGS